jgi:hypothetical protein
MMDKGPLQGTELVAIADPLDGDYLLATKAAERHHAGAHHDAIEKY